jgi:hypothetical protein
MEEGQPREDWQIQEKAYYEAPNQLDTLLAFGLVSTFQSLAKT